MNLVARIAQRAHELGFDKVGVTGADAPRHVQHLNRWLDDGFHADMGWMADSSDLRAAPNRLEPWARTAVVVAMSYGFDRELDSDREPGIARYALGLDYHDIMRAQLGRLAAFVRNEVGGETRVRATVDSAPVFERALALDAGIGWLGRSACVIDQTLGSYLLLGELLVGHDLEAIGTEHPDRCGTCTRCIDACPTNAIVSPYRVDSRRCISYLTIELGGAIPRALRPLVGLHLFGCDICQSVCPWNRKALRPNHDAFEPLHDLEGLSVAELLPLDDVSFRARFRNTPLYRPGREGLLRNATVYLGNLGDRRAVPTLGVALLGDPSATVRGHAAWALGQLGGAKARRLLAGAIVKEDVTDVTDEIEHAIAGSTLC